VVAFWVIDSVSQLQQQRGVLCHGRRTPVQVLELFRYRVRTHRWLFCVLWGRPSTDNTVDNILSPHSMCCMGGRYPSLHVA
jgi:hypothetical protein